MSIRNRVERLETAAGQGCGHPACPPTLVRRLRQDGAEGEPVVVQQFGTGERCPRCGRPAEGMDLIEVLVRTREEAKLALALMKEAA